MATESQDGSKSKVTEPSDEMNASGPVYTTFTRKQRRLLTFLLGLTTVISPLTATIYFPLLPLLSQRLHTSAQAINLTITIYIVFQALSPAIFASLSDSLGRRIIYLITLTLYALSNLGLALAQHSYVALIILRAVQSLGASAAFAISYGVVADVCVPAERGSMVGPISMALNLGTCVGPIVGGAVAYKSGDYNWVFWFLVVVGAVLLGAVAGFLPETARNVVGNGSVQAVEWWEKIWANPFRALPAFFWKKITNNRTEQHGSAPHVTEKNSVSQPDEPIISRRRKPNILDPLRCVRILFLKDAAPILIVHGLNYMIDYSIQTSIPSAFKEIYHFDELESGVSFLPRGFGIIAGGYFNGRLMDWNYKVTAKQIGHSVDCDRGDDLNHFPIEKARTRGSIYLISIMTASVIGYGWFLSQRSHVSIALILQFIQGFLGTSIYTFSSTLLVDILPETPSTAAAASSVTRCALAALGTATIEPLIAVLGRGWYFTLLGLFTGGASQIAVWTVRRWGMKWRIERVAKTRRPRADNGGP